MNRKLVFVLIVLFLVVGFFAFREEEPEIIVEPEEEIEETNLQEVVSQFLGRPYSLGPLGEGEDEEIYRSDVFDCTTLVLVSTAKLNSPENPEEEMKKINYYPPGEVSYENRLHYSTYRNKVSDYFEDITAQVAGDYLQSKTVVLNKDRLIDIDWEEELEVNYLPTENLTEVVSELPDEVGVMFMRLGNQSIGLDVNHEGFVFNQSELIHASPTAGQVHSEDFLRYVENSNYDGLIFYRVL